MQVLITRPRPQAEALARKLRRAGHRPLIAPVLRIELASRAPDWGAVDGLLLTSAQAARALAKMPGLARDLPVFAVGAKTAQAARAAGFGAVWAARGDAASLARLVRDHAGAKAGWHLAHACGEVTRSHALDDLAEGGIRVSRHVVYRAVAVQRLPRAAGQALAAGAVDWLLLYSPRSAEIFFSLVEQAGLSATIAELRIGCLSAAVAAAIGARRVGQIVVASEPSEPSLLNAVGLSAAAGRARRGECV
ncbi:MAG: uroporphyrinogen-III synthase [Sphingomonadales bacterium]